MEDSGPHAALRDNSPEEEQCENIVAGATADRTQSCEEPTMKRAKLTVVDDNSSAPQTKPFPCYLLGCGKSCPTRNALTKHLARYHSDRAKEKASKCPLCGDEGPQQRRHLDTKHKDDDRKEAALQALEMRTKKRVK